MKTCPESKSVSTRKRNGQGSSETPPTEFVFSSTFETTAISFISLDLFVNELFA